MHKYLHIYKALGSVTIENSCQVKELLYLKELRLDYVKMEISDELSFITFHRFNWCFKEESIFANLIRLIINLSGSFNRVLWLFMSDHLLGVAEATRYITSSVQELRATLHNRVGSLQAGTNQRRKNATAFLESWGVCRHS